MIRGQQVWVAVASWLAIVAVLPSAKLEAQGRDSIPGISLGMFYQSDVRTVLAVKPFNGRFGGAGLAPRVEAIIGRDVRNSDRFTVLDSLPSGLIGEGVDYALWDRLGSTWLVTGQVEGAGEGYVLLVELHDVVYGEVRERGRFRIPDEADPGFRMAIHRVSDQVVLWATGQPGMAASRIAFTMLDSNRAKELWVIDSDGENMRRITNDNALASSPAWSPDGSKIAYSSRKSGDVPRIFQLTLATGADVMLPAVRGDGDYQTPAYHPDGRTLAFAAYGGERSGVFAYDVERDCCLVSLTGGRWYDFSPTFSPDGGWMAFNTMRFGDHTPQIMIMPASGGEPETLSPMQYGSGGYYTSPDWSPIGDLVAFHGRIKRGTYHIIVADIKNNRRLKQLTWDGNNEDPTWAPDGRHIAFVAERPWGTGLFVIDVATGRMRTLVSGQRVGVPDWSPALPEGR